MASKASSRPVRNGNSQAAAADSRTPLLSTTPLMFYEESSWLPMLCAFRLPSMASSHQMALKWRDEVPVVGVGKVWHKLQELPQRMCMVRMVFCFGTS